jgi:hypothetical protein
LWWTSENSYYPLFCGDLIVETELVLGDHSEWIRVERDPALCVLHNGDVGMGDRISGTNLVLLYVDVSYAAPQAHGFVNVALHWEYSSGIVFIFSQGRKDLYHIQD